MTTFKYYIKFNTRELLFMMYYWSGAVLQHCNRLHCSDLHWTAGFTHTLHPSALTCTAFSKHQPSGPMLSISRNVRLSVCLWVCVSVCLFPFEVPFKRLFAPTSRSRMSNIFRDSESLGKSNWKRWYNIWTFLFDNCLKLPGKKNCVFCWFCLTKHGGNHASRWIRYLWSKGVSQILAYL